MITDLIGWDMNYKIYYSCVSHVGLCRSMNQDNLICNRQYMPLPGSKNELPFIDKGVVFSVTPALFGVFDGMGGEKQGEMAAYIAAKTACNIALEGAPLERLNAFCQLANDSICQYASEHGNHAMGTTAAMLFLRKRGFICATSETAKYFCSPVIDYSRYLKITSPLASVGRNHRFYKIWGFHRAKCTFGHIFPVAYIMMETYILFALMG